MRAPCSVACRLRFEIRCGCSRDSGRSENFLETMLTSMDKDTDPDWRPRVPQWPAVGETMSVAIQQALSGQQSPKAALDGAQRRIEQIMRA